MSAFYGCMDLEGMFIRHFYELCMAFQPPCSAPASAKPAQLLLAFMKVTNAETLASLAAASKFKKVDMIAG